MNKKITGLVVVVVLVLGAWIIFGHSKNNSNNNPNTNSSQTQNSNNSNTTQTTDSANNITGTLKASNNVALGNLMLVTDNQVLYLRTSRDFSALVSKKVSVSYNGTLTNFTLLNITAAQ